MKRLRRYLRAPAFNNPGAWKHERRIAVTGFSRSGKTVFITSLIDQLLNHDTVRFFLGDGVSVVKPTLIAPRSKWPQFDFAENRRNLSAREPKWPEKTRKITSATVDFEFSHWRLARARLTVFDIPGERFADCSMYRNDFREWSNKQIQWLGGLQNRPPAVDSFLTLINRRTDREPDETAVLSAYKEALASLYVDYHKHLSPSVFVLNTEGEHIWDEDKGCRDLLKRCDFPAVASRRKTGLDDGEFAPLSISILDRKWEIERRFKANYARYRRQIVEDVFATLARCDSLAVLIDVAHILQGGESVCDDADKFLRDILKALGPGKQWHHLLRSLLPTRTLRGSPITEIAFIGTQIDRFHDQDHPQVRRLLDRLVQRHFQAYKGATTKSFLVSAVCSAVSDELADLLHPTLMEEVTAKKYSGTGVPVARLPSSSEWQDWPDHWDPQELFIQHGGFPRLSPRIPRRRGAAPDHLGLDDIFRFLYGI